MDKTRLALIGVGMIGKRHLKAMRDVEEAELAALVDTVPGVSGLAREWSVPFFETTDSMLKEIEPDGVIVCTCLLYTSPSPRDRTRSRMPSSA